MWFTKTLKTDQNAGLTSSTVNPVTRITVGKVHFCKTKAKKKAQKHFIWVKEKKCFGCHKQGWRCPEVSLKKQPVLSPETRLEIVLSNILFSHLSSTFSYESHTINMYWECVMTDIAHFPWRLSCPQLWGPDSKGLGLPCFLTSI